jgi:Protein of unknown function (DUF2911)
MRHLPARLFRASLVLTALVVAPSGAGAQIVASERATVSQTVDGTKISVDYSRPRARGRTNIYGGMEKWGTTWTPGADDATTLDVNKPITVLGLTVPKGRYSVWFVLREREPWTFVLDPRDTLFHTDHPDSTAQQLRATFTPHTVAHTEVLTWEFPAVSTTGATLAFRWGTMGAEFPLTVMPSLPLMVGEAEAAPFVGEYTYAWTDPESKEKPSRFTVVRRDGKLFGVWEPAQFGTMREMQLLPNGPDRFAYGFMRNGELWSTNPRMNVRFTRTNGRVSGFEYGDGTEVFARATRK